ncbi:MAG: isoaspartyl peptidase/L-asparaginase [Bacteroidota bacterium]|jgi:beta-aspartyl-peptidase (threonine type)
MNKPFLSTAIILIAAVLFSCSSNQQEKTATPPEKPAWAIVIHGGAGTIKKESMTPEKDSLYRAKLAEALLIGSEILKNGGTSMDAVEQTIHVLEESPLFNAGRGSVFNERGQNEMDAAIMNGQTHAAGAVVNVHTIKSPISAARAVMEKSEHVMLTGEGAELFAEKQGLEIVKPEYFFDQNRWDSFIKAKDKLDKHGTVGCVALDQNGNIAAGTSTGGMTMKMYGRVGDVPVIGAGTYADNATCGISATGHGEFFIRNVVAYDVAALMKYKGLSIEEAANEVIMNKLLPIGGSGGIIGLDANGNIIMTFNSEGMFRGKLSSNSEMVIGIYKEE